LRWRGQILAEGEPRYDSGTGGTAGTVRWPGDGRFPLLPLLQRAIAQGQAAWRGAHGAGRMGTPERLAAIDRQ
jgi:hypothetical protein